MKTEWDYSDSSCMFKTKVALLYCMSVFHAMSMNRAATDGKVSVLKEYIDLEKLYLYSQRIV